MRKMVFWGVGKGFQKKRHWNQDRKKFLNNLVNVNDILVIINDNALSVRTRLLWTEKMCTNKIVPDQTQGLSVCFLHQII